MGRRVSLFRPAAATLLALAMIALAPAGPVLAQCVPATGAGCDLRSRIAAAEAFVATRPGTVGYVLRDRTSGLRYRNAHAATMIWTASTIKLAMVVDLLTRERAGTVRLSAEDRQLMQAMLRGSDNDATDTLWDRYGGPDHRAFNAGFPRYGMTSVAPQPGFGSVFPYWGFQKGTAEMQKVAPNQQWGVWGAGPQMAPGNKNGWSQEQGGWVVNSVGFAGPAQRYTLTVFNALNGEGGFDDGVQTTTGLGRILLGR